MTEPDIPGAESETRDEPAGSVPLRYVYTPAFAALIEQLGISLLISTYQAGKLMVVRARAGRISTLLRNFERVMGLAVRHGEMVVGTRNAVWRLRDAPDIADGLDLATSHDACYLPRSCHITGDIRGHELAFCGNDLYIVNTRFNCLATLGDQYSFVPRWRPPFIRETAAGDRCHLSGLCVVACQPRFVTAHAATNEPDGWRAKKLDGGVILDIPTGQVVTGGLCMPHSPRWHDGALWVLNSGMGELQRVDLATGKRQTVIRLPGYARGLAFHDRFAFVALSTIREKREFGGVPVEQQTRLQCAVHAVDLQSGISLGAMSFDSGCTEIFDVQTLPGRRWPQVIGLQKEAINDVFVVP